MKKAVMYGAGNIGRGFIGQLLSLSGYEVVFLDINRPVIDALNEHRRYPLRLVGPSGAEETYVENVRGVDSSDTERAACEIADADILATAVGANVLPVIAPVIAKGLEMRWKGGEAAPLNILICENLPDAHKHLEALLLGSLAGDARRLFAERVGLVEATIGRMVPAATEAMREGNILRVWAEPYGELPVDRDGFKGAIPAIQGMKPFAPFEFHIERKLYMHNMSHALLAYMGRLAGHEYVWQAVRDPMICGTARGALGESSEALGRKHGVPLEELAAYSDDLMLRFDNPLLGDTVARVGRDPVRKLGRYDRLAGAMFLCLEQGVEPAHICAGVAAALLFDLKEDEASQRIQQSVTTKGAGRTLEQFCGIDARCPAYPLILEYYNRYRDAVNKI
jgi:mannitol-1-phosphate 5-dehydrogenase